MFKHGQKVTVLRGRYEGLTVVFDSYSETRPDRCFVSFVGFNMRGAMLNVSDIAPVDSPPCVRSEAQRLADMYGLDVDMLSEKLEHLQALAQQHQGAHIDELVAMAEKTDMELHNSYANSADFKARMMAAVAAHGEV